MPLEEITVTGSRILRRDFEANAPITTIDQSTFQATGTVGVETVLNQLPQFVPAITQFTTTDVQADRQQQHRRIVRQPARPRSEP